MKQNLNVFFLSIFLIIGCGKNEILITEKKEMDSLDYIVMAAAIENTIYSKFDTVNYDTVKFERFFRLIIDTTTIDTPKPWLVDKHRVNYPEEDHLVTGLLNMNQKTFYIDSTKLKTKFAKVVIASNDIRDYINSKNADTITFNSFRLSIPYIDKKSGLALILKQFLSSHQTSNEFIWLKQINDKWIVYDRWYDSY